VYYFGLGRDTPIVGDWNGAGKDEIGVVRSTNGTLAWSLDSNGDGMFDGGDEEFSLGLATDTPIVGDWNGSGTTKIGTVRPLTTGLMASHSTSRATACSR